MNELFQLVYALNFYTLFIFKLSTELQFQNIKTFGNHRMIVLERVPFGLNVRQWNFSANLYLRSDGPVPQTG